MNALLTVSDVVATHARLEPDKIGARDSRRALTSARWDERASRLANALLGLGLVKGDRDEDGCYHLADRKRNMIISDGENVFPMEVEVCSAPTRRCWTLR